MNLQDTFEADNLQGAPKIVLETSSGLDNSITGALNTLSIDEGIPEETETEIDESQVMKYTFFSIFFVMADKHTFAKVAFKSLVN